LLIGIDSVVLAENLGEIVKFPDSEWTVLSARNIGSTAKSTNLFAEDATTDGKFIIVQFQVKNISKQTESILETPILVDSEQREFKEYSEQDFYIPANAKSIMMEQLPPSIPKKFYAMYEVPLDSKKVQFRTRSLSFSPQYKLVNLNLN
jgi:hypothetical protein